MKSAWVFVGMLFPMAAFSDPTSSDPTASDPAWVTGVPESQEIPANAVYSGAEIGVPNYVCHAPYMNGIHPGKLFAGHCNIEFAGQEMVRNDFEILTADAPTVSWVQDSVGFVPERAFASGEENGSPLYACRAQVNLDSLDRGLHGGKLIGENCNVPYGGGAYLAKIYEVLVIQIEEPVAVRKAYGNKVGEAGNRTAAGAGFAADGRALPRLPAKVVRFRN